MRQGTDKAGILKHDDVFFGVCLGADFCAEHEHGIGDLKQDYGIVETSDAKGILNLKMNKFPAEELLLFTKGQSTYLLSSRSVAWSAKDEAAREKFKADFHRHPHDLNIYGEKQMAGAWSERDFGIHLKGKEGKALLEELYKAITSGDAAFGFTGALPAFDNAGLCIFIISKFPKVFNDSIIEQQEEKQRLNTAAEKTGLIAYLESKGKGHYKGYFACSPRFDDKHPDGIRWWLNPYDQQENGSGWFSTQQLMDWADGKEGNPISGHGFRSKAKA